MDDELVGIRKLARTLEIRPGWLATEAEAGRIPSLRTDNGRFFSVAAVRQCLLQRAASECDGRPYLITLSEAAAQLALDRAVKRPDEAIARMCKKGELIGILVGRTMMVDARSVARVINGEA